MRFDTIDRQRERVRPPPGLAVSDREFVHVAVGDGGGDAGQQDHGDTGQNPDDHVDMRFV